MAGDLGHLSSSSPPTSCMREGCGKSSASRGLCRAHYMEQWRLRKAKKATEAELVDAGLLKSKAGGELRRLLEQARERAVAK